MEIAQTEGTERRPADDHLTMPSSAAEKAFAAASCYSASSAGASANSAAMRCMICGTSGVIRQWLPIATIRLAIAKQIFHNGNGDSYT